MQHQDPVFPRRPVQPPTDVVQVAAKPGWKTSEFWLAIVAIAAVTALPHADQAVGAAGDRLAQHGVAGAIAAGAIAGAYAVGRSLVKALAAKAALTPDRSE